MVLPEAVGVTTVTSSPRKIASRLAAWWMYSS